MARVDEFDSPFNGEFDNLILPELSGGRYWDTSQLYSGGLLLLVVPEPGRALLLLLAAGVLAVRRRRPGCSLNTERQA